MRSRRDITVAIGIVIGLACAGLPFAALAQNFFPGFLNPFGAQRAAPTFGAPVQQGAPPRAPAAPVQQGTPPGTQPHARSSADRVRRGAPSGTQRQASTPADPDHEPPPTHTRRHRVGRRVAHHDEGQAWCVRDCDGRYFPISGLDDKSQAESCSNFCPASQITLVHGDDIDSAETDNGKRYSELPNAFRYRKELVAGCTCDGKGQTGLAKIGIDNDRTLRKGDIVAGAEGLQVAKHDADMHSAPEFSPLSRSARARFRHLPVVASGR